MKIDIAQLPQRNKAVFAIKLAEKAMTYLQNEYRDLIIYAISLCWEWIRTTSHVGERLYLLLDNEDDGFVLIQEFEEDEIKIQAWNCIIDAISFISRMAYESEGQEYFPEPIEIVDDNIFEHMVRSLLLCNNDEKLYIIDTYKICLKGFEF